MCSDSYSEFYRLVQQCISTNEVGKLKCETLNEMFAALSRSGIEDKKTNIFLRSVLRVSSHGNKIGYSTLNEVYKFLKKLRKPNNPLREICDKPNQNNVQQNVKQQTAVLDPRNNFKYTYQLRSSHRGSHIHSPLSTSKYTTLVESKNIEGALKITTKSCEPVAVHETETSETHEKSHTGFLQNFGLERSDSSACPKIISSSKPSISMSMFKHSANVPFSSELGRLLAERVNHSVSDDFKLRKLQRLERYINKPFTEINENIIYPVTYVERNKDVSTSKKESKRKKVSCKPLSVVIEKADLVELKKKLEILSRKRMRDRLYRLRKKCKNLKVVMRPSDRKNIEKFLKKRRKI